MKGLIVVLLMLLSIGYLLNPGMGIFDLIPDNFPIVGNLDEAAATALLISCLAYFGIDLGRLFGRGRKKSGDEAEREAPRQVDGAVIDVESEKGRARKR